MLAKILVLTVMLGGVATTAESCEQPPQKNPPKVSPKNMARNQTLDPGTVTDHKRYGAKSYWLQIDRDGERTWGKVRRSSYARCDIGDKWPSCRKDKS